MATAYQKDSISLAGAIAMGTGVMIGAGIFALTGQIAQLAGLLFPLSFLVGAVVTAFSAYTYVKMSNAYPSAGGIAMTLQKAYGPTTIAAGAALLMALSMVINESLVARTFGIYTLRAFGIGEDSLLVPVLGVGLIVFAYLVNVSGNRSVGLLSIAMAVLKVGGIALFGAAALWAAASRSKPPATRKPAASAVFSHRLPCRSWHSKASRPPPTAGGDHPSPPQCRSRHHWIDRDLRHRLPAGRLRRRLQPLTRGDRRGEGLRACRAAEPAFGQMGVYMTVALAIVATASGLIASVFAVSRMLAMLTDMKIIPHSHFGMPGPIHEHTLVYTVVIAGILTVFFDLSRIASLGVFFYLVMDIIIHWGVLRHLRREIDAAGWVLALAILLDLVVLGAFGAVKLQSDPLIVGLAVAGIAVVFLYERIFLSRQSAPHPHGRH